MDVKFNVKQESFNSFMEQRLLYYKPEDFDKIGVLRNNNYFYLLKDEMYFKKECGINVGEIVKIELFDRSNISNRDLVNTYVYKAQYYDDIAIKMVLIDFSISLK